MSKDYKNELIELAKSNEKKPPRGSKMFFILSNYTNKKAPMYDGDFSETIKLIRPEWFRVTIEEKKAKLLEMARDINETRPSPYDKTDTNRRKMGTALFNYTCKSSGTYDAEFTAKLLAIRHDWVVRTASAENKKILLEMAAANEKRPSRHSPDPELNKLGVVLISYTYPRSSSYDPEFAKKISEINPDWFKDTAADKKKKILLDMAAAGAKKPSAYDIDNEDMRKLAGSLSNYISPTSASFDAEFTENLRHIRPDWFVRSSVLKKERLIELAMAGADRPSISSKDRELRCLATSLANYACKSSPDKEFAEKIHNLRPDWFKTKQKS
jgi:hypothetical protein